MVENKIILPQKKKAYPCMSCSPLSSEALFSIPLSTPMERKTGKTK
jgi:hypothetical protein